MEKEKYIQIFVGVYNDSEIILKVFKMFPCENEASLII